jgi:hypothetical protein
MASFCAKIDPKPNQRVLDLGGQPGIWSHVRTPLNITLLNLPGIADPVPSSHHKFVQVEGDACDLSHMDQRAFDIVYSNSVIEHVGGESRQRAFARQVLRFEASYWVQTPARSFPIEAHSGMPFWWFYPSSVRRRFLARWRRSLPAWTEMIENTTYVAPTVLEEIFPGSNVLIERFCGMPKSYVVWKRRQ